jgi:hypothetical protein
MNTSKETDIADNATSPIPNLDTIKEIRELVIAGLTDTQAGNLQETAKSALFSIHNSKMCVNISYQHGIDADTNDDIYNIIVVADYTSAISAVEVLRTHQSDYSCGGKIIHTPHEIADAILKSNIFNHPDNERISYKYTGDSDNSQASNSQLSNSQSSNSQLSNSQSSNSHAGKKKINQVVLNDEDEWINLATRAGDRGIMVILAGIMFAAAVIVYGMYLEITGANIGYEL